MCYCVINIFIICSVLLQWMVRKSLFEVPIGPVWYPSARPMCSILKTRAGPHRREVWESPDQGRTESVTGVAELSVDQTSADPGDQCQCHHQCKEDICAIETSVLGRHQCHQDTRFIISDNKTDEESAVLLQCRCCECHLQPVDKQTPTIHHHYRIKSDWLLVRKRKTNNCWF